MSSVMRTSSSAGIVLGPFVSTAFGGAAHVVKATYHGPYQGHMPFGPNCAVADVTSGGAVVMCSTQSVYGTRDKVAKVLGIPAANVRYGTARITRRIPVGPARGRLVRIIEYTITAEDGRHHHLHIPPDGWLLPSPARTTT